MWVLHFRSVVSFGNTNNGVEALNRVLKQNVLQHRKNNAVSFLLTVSVVKLRRRVTMPLSFLMKCYLFTVASSP